MHSVFVNKWENLTMYGSLVVQSDNMLNLYLDRNLIYIT